MWEHKPATCYMRAVAVCPLCNVQTFLFTNERAAILHHFLFWHVNQVHDYSIIPKSVRYKVDTQAENDSGWRSWGLAWGSHDVTCRLTEALPLDHPSGHTSPWISVNWNAFTNLSTSPTDRPTGISLIMELRIIPLPSIMNNALGGGGGGVWGSMRFKNIPIYLRSWRLSLLPIND